MTYHNLIEHEKEHTTHLGQLAEGWKPRKALVVDIDRMLTGCSTQDSIKPTHAPRSGRNDWPR